MTVPLIPEELQTKPTKDLLRNKRIYWFSLRMNQKSTTNFYKISLIRMMNLMKPPLKDHQIYYQIPLVGSFLRTLLIFKNKFFINIYLAKVCSSSCRIFASLRKPKAYSGIQIILRYLAWANRFSQHFTSAMTFSKRQIWQSCSALLTKQRFHIKAEYLAWSPTLLFHNYCQTK